MLASSVYPRTRTRSKRDAAAAVRNRDSHAAAVTVTAKSTTPAASLSIRQSHLYTGDKAGPAVETVKETPVSEGTAPGDGPAVETAKESSVPEGTAPDDGSSALAAVNLTKQHNTELGNQYTSALDLVELAHLEVDCAQPSALWPSDHFMLRCSLAVTPSGLQR